MESASNELHNQAHRLLSHCGCLRRDESVLIIHDETTADVGRVLAGAAGAITERVTRRAIPSAVMHGTEPPPDVAREMSVADLVVGVTYTSMAHTRARRLASERGVRYLSLPEYSTALLAAPALAVDYHESAPLVRSLSDAFTHGRSIRVTSAAGTDITLNIEGRSGNYCPGFVSAPGQLGSPPDIEANVSPVETASEGTIVVDGSIPCREIGLLSQPARLTVTRGSISLIESSDEGLQSSLASIFARVASAKAYVLAECGVGLNAAAELNGTMLMDEGALGCVHFGFGSNATVGGTNDVPFHLDCVIRTPSLAIDGKLWIDQGKLTPW
jgi:2,5-dihydroxypyridine 5,6-dioxygenase